jgi:substrate-binding family protein
MPPTDEHPDDPEPSDPDDADTDPPGDAAAPGSGDDPIAVTAGDAGDGDGAASADDDSVAGDPTDADPEAGQADDADAEAGQADDADPEAGQADDADADGEPRGANASGGGRLTGPPARRSRWRRYGPVGAVVVLLAVIATGAVALRGGDDERTDLRDDFPEYAGRLPDEVVTWSMAQEQDLDVTFPDTCDTESGYVAIPFFFRTECVADVEDNHGATADGVTGDEITIVLWLPKPDDPIYGFVRQALGFDDSVDDMRETQEGLVEIFQSYYQTYGRQVRVEFFEASGDILDPVVAQSDAIAVADMHPFAVLGGPLIQGQWTEELAARHIVCILCPGASVEDTAPYFYTLLPRPRQVREHTVSYVSRKLAGHPAEHAGGDLAGQERVFAYLKLGIGSGEQQAEDMEEDLADAGVDLAETVVYPLDPGAIAENATNIVAQLRDAGVTSVIVDADPLTLPAITEEATKQHWFPEWVLAAPLLSDTSTFGRTMDQEQWAHAFGFSYLPPASVPEAVPGYQLYEWYFGEPPPADESLLLTYPQIALFFTGVEMAGPNLTPETFRDGLFAWPPTPHAVTQPSLDYGTGLWDYADFWGIDDMVELWWDPEAEGPDETGAEGRGLYRYVDGGRRYYADEWPEVLRVFDDEGAVTSISEPPPAEVPSDYPSPNGG